MKRFNIGIIGCGKVLPMHAESICNIKDLELAAVCDIKENRAKRAARGYDCAYYTDYKKMLEGEDLDAVHLLTPHYLHAPMAIEAVRHRMHVMTEKPIALTLKDATKMIDEARRHRVKLGVIFQTRYSPGAILVKRNLLNGKLGKIKACKLVLSYHKPDSYYKESDWKGTWKKEGGGVIIDQAIHYLDLLRWLIDDDARFIDASIHNRCHDYIEVEDCAEGVIGFKNGSQVFFYLINCYSYDADTQIEIHCTKGRVRIIKHAAYIRFNNGKESKAEPKRSDYIDYGNGVKDYWGFYHGLEIEDFYNSIRYGRKIAIDGQEGKETQRLVLGIYKSAKEGKKIYF